MSKRILILAPHPDDEVLGFGGLITKSIEAGDQVWVHVFTMGGPASNVSSEVRLDEYTDAMNFLEVTKRTYSGYGKDGLLDQVPNCELTGQIDHMIAEWQPDEVYCSALSEHSDHQALYKAFMGSARLKSGFMPRSFAIGTYPFSGQLYAVPEGGKVFCPLTEEQYAKKLEAFKLYKSQFKPAPSPLGERGLRIMSEYHGMMCGSVYAELFYQIRYIKP